MMNNKDKNLEHFNKEKEIDLEEASFNNSIKDKIIGKDQIIVDNLKSSHQIETRNKKQKFNSLVQKNCCCKIY